MSSRDSAGFSLIEAVIALLIVSGVLAGAFTVQAADLRVRRQAEQLRQAAVLLEEVHARAEILSTDELTALAGARVGRFPPPMEEYSWELQASRSDAQPELFDLRMAVLWNSGSLRASTRLSPHAGVRR